MPSGNAFADPSSHSSLDGAIKAFNKALEENSVPELQHWLAPEWTVIDGDGSIISRAHFLDVVGSGVLKHGPMRTSEPSVQRFGDTALVTVHVQGTGSYGGTQFGINERSTDVYVFRRGAWSCVLTQLTTIKRSNQDSPRQQ
jgi:hypothetical protein